MKAIIVSTDFSPAATHAMHYALDMAMKIQASVIFYHAYQVPVSYSDVPLMLVSVEELKQSAGEKLDELKNNAERITSGKIKIYTELRMGDVIDELQNLCEHIKPFAVVMGTKGASGLERVLFGSNTLTAIRHLTWPVICVPPGKLFGEGIKKIGFACDFKNVVETTPADVIINFTKEFGAELHVLNVDYRDRSFRPDTPEQSALLHTLLQEANPQYHFIEHEDIEDGINDFAEKNNLDLIIAIPKKHKLLESLFKPSSTRQLVFESRVPVMCIHE
ncbi:MAG: universal stress protein [Chitinophagaceae bacterium]|nr:universal stress protein [Chitinophagaceae bacterium]